MKKASRFDALCGVMSFVMHGFYVILFVLFAQAWAAAPGTGDPKDWSLAEKEAYIAKVQRERPGMVPFVRKWLGVEEEQGAAKEPFWVKVQQQEGEEQDPFGLGVSE